MNLLAKIGSIILKGTEILLGFGSTIQQQFPGTSSVVTVISKDLTDVANIVTQVEVMGQALQIKGPDKLKAAAPLIAQIILQSALMADKKIESPDLFQQGCTKVADGMADILNSLHANVETTSKT